MARLTQRMYIRDEFPSTIEAIEKGIDFDKNAENIVANLNINEIIAKDSNGIIPKKEVAEGLAKKLSYTHSASMAGIVNMLMFGNRGYITLESEGCLPVEQIKNGLDSKMGWNDSVYLTLGLVNFGLGDFALVYDRKEIEKIQSFIATTHPLTDSGFKKDGVFDKELVLGNLTRSTTTEKLAYTIITNSLDLTKERISGRWGGYEDDSLLEIKINKEIQPEFQKAVIIPETELDFFALILKYAGLELGNRKVITYISDVKDDSAKRDNFLIAYYKSILTNEEIARYNLAPQDKIKNAAVVTKDRIEELQKIGSITRIYHVGSISYTNPKTGKISIVGKIVRGTEGIKAKLLPEHKSFEEYLNGYTSRPQVIDRWFTGGTLNPKKPSDECFYDQIQKIHTGDYKLPLRKYLQSIGGTMKDVLENEFNKLKT